DFGGNAQHLLFALQAVNSPAAVSPLIEMIAAGKLSPDRQEIALTLVASHGGPKELQKVFDLACKKETHLDQRIRLLGGLEQAARQRRVKPDGDLTRIGEFIRPTDYVYVRAVRLVGLWKLESKRGELAELARPSNKNDAEREAALDGLTMLGDADCRNFIGELAGGPCSRRYPAP